jgi:hypothetical protein
MPDGTVHACDRETDWAPFVYDERSYEWCATRALVGGDTAVAIVAVRRPEDAGASVGAAFPPDTKLTEEHARAQVERTR